MKDIRPFSLENSGEDRPKMFLPSQKKIRYGHQNMHHHYQGIVFRQSEKFITAVKLGRGMLQDEGCPTTTVLDLPVNEEKEEEDDPEEDYLDEEEEEEEDPIQLEQDQCVTKKVNGARRAPFNLKVRFLSEEFLIKRAIVGNFL